MSLLSPSTKKPGTQPGFFVSPVQHLRSSPKKSVFTLGHETGSDLSFGPLGKRPQVRVDNDSSYPHGEKSPGYMGKLRRSVQSFSPCKIGNERRDKRTCLVFPSIPTPYYYEYDHVFIKLRKS